jgi:hypothetical protein
VVAFIVLALQELSALFAKRVEAVGCRIVAASDPEERQDRGRNSCMTQRLFISYHTSQGSL